MLTFSSFVLLVAGTQAASPNILAPQAMKSGELEVELGARRALANDLPKEIQMLVDGIPSVGKYVPIAAFVSAIGATVLMALRLVSSTHGSGGKVGTNLVVGVASALNCYSSTRETLREYAEATEKQAFLDWVKANFKMNTMRFVASVGNFIAMVFAFVGYNNKVTFPLAVSQYVFTSIGNWPELCKEHLKPLLREHVESICPTPP